MSLELPGNVTIDEVTYAITGNGIAPIGGVIDTSGPGTTVSFSVSVPAGEGYLLELSAASTDGERSCRGSTPFDIQAGQTTSVLVGLSCKRTGDVNASGEFNHCAEVSQPYVSQTQISVGDTIQLSVVGVDEENDPIEYTWFGGGGTFSPPPPMGASTSYYCTDAGVHTLGVVLSDDGFDKCAEGWTTSIECASGPPPYPPDSILVSATGPGAGDTPDCGTDFLHACATIAYGLNRANNTPGTEAVVVSAGVYDENIVLVNGIDVLGGYNDLFTMRDIGSLPTTLRGGPGSPATVTALNITQPTSLEGFVIWAPFSNEPSSDSIGIHISNSSSALAIQNNLIFGGAAGDGSNGVSGGDGANGSDGADGAASIQLFASDPDPGPLPGGTGGALTVAGTVVSGGNGGESRYPIFDSPNLSGLNGQGPSGGLGGLPGSSGSWLEPQCTTLSLPSGPFDSSDGAVGADGGNGAPGLGGIAGAGVNAAGQDGADATPGSGGGGGGAAGGAVSSLICDQVGPLTLFGPSGGGGGSGAAGGGGGLGGGAGGGSFGIVVDGTGVPTIVGNEIYLGTAGNGGAGGFGGRGGEGGLGAQGGTPGILTGSAGDGARGGNGGHGGGGGGGAGGLSVGIRASFDATGTYDVQNLIDVGTGRAGLGGSGGLSLGAVGQDGQAGQVLAVLFQP